MGLRSLSHPFFVIPTVSEQVMRINFRRFAAFVAQQVLNIAQINAFFQQVGSEGVAKGMHGGMRVHARAFFSLGENFLYAALTVLATVGPFKNPFDGFVEIEIGT